MLISVTINQRTVSRAEEGSLLSEVLYKNGYSLNASCGGKGICGKCKAEVIYGSGERETVLACKYRIFKDISVIVQEGTYSIVTAFQAPKTNKIVSRYLHSDNCLAVDIGTTTMAFSLFSGGKKIDCVCCCNPQFRHGADVISRIEYAGNNQEELCEELRGAINSVIKDLCKKHNLEAIDRLFATGNTAMLHFLMGHNAEPLGVYPYATPFLDAEDIEGDAVGIFARRVYTASCISAFIGGDVVCGAVACNLTSGDLLIDIGTNGEMMLKAGDTYYCTSVAAGPALEGGNISKGVGAVTGAISSFFMADGKINYKTIGDAPAIGLCGSGLLSGIACMLRLGVIDAGGAIVGEGTSRDYFLNYITQKDVRAFQLAKAAIRAGAELLLKLADFPWEKLKNIYVAGGMGYNLDVEAALAVGLFPLAWRNKLHVVGNAALAGAELCTMSENDCCATVINHAKAIDLSQEPEFQELFLRFTRLANE